MISAVKSLVNRLADKENVLLVAYRGIAKAAGEGRPITPVAEWGKVRPKLSEDGGTHAIVVALGRAALA